MKFREHRGGLIESMKTLVELNTRREFSHHLGKVVRKIVPKEACTIRFVEYGFDTRIGWDTYLVILDGQGPIGMLNGPPPISWFPVEFAYGEPEAE